VLTLAATNAVVDSEVASSVSAPLIVKGFLMPWIKTSLPDSPIAVKPPVAPDGVVAVPNLKPEKLLPTCTSVDADEPTLVDVAKLGGA
jgi:hypothetical protein